MIKSTGAVVVPSPSSATNKLADADIHDIRPPVDIPNGWEWLWWVLGGALLLLAIWGLWKWMQSRPKTASVPRLSPEMRARQQLDDALRWLHEPKTFCTALSDAIRLYLEERFELHAPERTTEEFLNELQQSSRLDAEQKLTLGEFLGSCDLVKFAKHEPAETELRTLYFVGHRLVDETAGFRPAAVAAGQGGES